MPRALVSVYDKDGIDDFARGVAELGWTLVSSGGTAAHLEGLGLNVTPVEEVTGAPEMLGGRVKTLHPRIHGGILARRDIPEDMEALAALEIETFELVCVNLYPFTSVAGQRGVTELEVVEMIDVGGPSMLRAAAKNFAHVAVVTSPSQYERVLALLRDDALDVDARRELAREAFAVSAAYDASIAAWFAETERFPERLMISLEKVTDLSYGENPHQAAAYYREVGARRDLLSRVEQLGGKELSYNNLGDLEGARRVIREFELPAVVIVKHANPCGVAIGSTLLEAYDRAYTTDPESAFGGIIAFNRELDAETAKAIVDRQFVEVIIAPRVAPAAVEVVAAKKNVRLLSCGEWPAEPAQRLDMKRVNGGLLVQDTDLALYEGLKVVTKRAPTEKEMEDLLFTWRVAKFVKSNAIVYGKDGMTIGVGAGQMSRVNSARIAAIKAEHAGLEVKGAVMASDAFFPFRDGLDNAAAVGVTAVIQPGGSVRDEEVIAAADEHGIAMVFTSMRHFRH